MLPSHRELFDIPREVAYLNSASYSPLPRRVREAGEAGVRVKSMPWLMDPARIAHQADQVRAAAARLIGATADDIAIVNAAAYGVATAAANLAVPKGSRILLASGEFPSLALEWARRAECHGAILDIVPRPTDHDWTASLLARIDAPGLPPVSVAALTPLAWTDGALIDLDRLVVPLRAQGAAIIVDATQAAGILPLDVNQLGADYLVFPTYKWLLGPYTLAFLYVAPHRQDGTPLEQHGASRQGGTEPYQGPLPSYIETGRRFDMGQRFNPVSLPMALAGMELLQSWTQPAMARRLRSTTDNLAEIAANHGLSPLARAFRPPHILGVRAPARVSTPALVASLAEHGVYVAERGGQIRIGAHVFNDEGDIERFASALARCSAQELAS